MSLLNNVDFLRQVILHIADEMYQQDVSECDMEESVIGPLLEYESKKEWMQCWIEEKYQEVKNKMLEFKSKDLIETESLENSVSDKIYNMKLFERIQIDVFTHVIRIPGGWVCNSTNPAVTGQTFVPYNNEFEPPGAPENAG